MMSLPFSPIRHGGRGAILSPDAKSLQHMHQDLVAVSVYEHSSQSVPGTPAAVFSRAIREILKPAGPEDSSGDIAHVGGSRMGGLGGGGPRQPKRALM
jgi:hypothetical protein